MGCSCVGGGQSANRVAGGSRPGHQIRRGPRYLANMVPQGSALKSSPGIAAQVAAARFKNLHLPHGGEHLRPAGRLLGQTGTALQDASDTCGTSQMVSMFGPTLASLVAAVDQEEVAPDRPWTGADLQPGGFSSSQACSSRGRQVAVLRFVSADGRPGPDWTALKVRAEGPASHSKTVRAQKGPFLESSSSRIRREVAPAPSVSTMGRESVAGPLPCSGGDGATSVTPRTRRSLAGRSWIDLGPSPTGNLRACVPASFVPTVSKGAMKEAFIPDWLAMCAPGGTSDWAMANRSIHWSSDPVHGLFWDDGYGFYHRALLHAVLTLYGYRGTAASFSRMSETCKLDAEFIRRKVDRGDKWIKSGSDWCPDIPEASLSISEFGQVTATRTKGGFVAWAYGKVRLCDRFYEVEAALADYYFYWAHRLYAWVVEGHGTSRDLVVGYFCARAALSELVELSGIILHEAAHLSGSYFHCDPKIAEAIEGFPSAILSAETAGDLAEAIFGAIVALLFYLTGVVGLGAAAAYGLIAGLLADAADVGDTESGPQDCCQFGLGRSFRWKVWARLGAPPAQMRFEAEADRGGDRFIDAVGAPRALRTTGKALCRPMTFDGVIDAYLVPGSSGSFQWVIPAHCSRGPVDAGFESW